MKTILVPTDFSPVAENAMRFAAEMARQMKAPLLLLHVYQLPVIVNEVSMLPANAEEMKASADEKLQELKYEVEKMTMGSVPVFVQSRMGSVSGELEEVCRDIQPFAVIMGTKGVSRMENLLFGSATFIAINHLHVPVMVIPPDTVYRPIRKIGLACDYRKITTTTPDKEIKAVVKEFGAELHVVNVDSHFEHFCPDGRKQAAVLHDLLAELHPHYHFIHTDNIEESLDDFAQRNELDILIVIPKKHAFPEGLFHKSHSKKLATHAHVPVMAIHE